MLPKIDFEFSPLAHKVLRLPGFIAAVNVLGRVSMDAFMVAPIVHLLPRLPDKVLVRVLPLYDKWSRLLYRVLLRATVDDPAYRKALVPRIGILAKRPVISSAFFTALNNPNTALITTPIERITRTGVRTTDGVEREADLIVAATGYELWTDPETYRPGTILGANGFDLAEYYRAHGMRSYAGTAHPRLPNRWEIVGPTGFVGFAWMDYDETMTEHAVRMIDETRRRGAQVVEVSHDAFNRWNERMRRRRQGGSGLHRRMQSWDEQLLRQLPRRGRLLPAPNHHRVTAIRPSLAAVRLRVLPRARPSRRPLPKEVPA